MYQPTVHPLADISLVDFGNVADVCGFASLVFSCAGTVGMLSSPSTGRSAMSSKIVAIARNWIDSVDTRISDMTPGDALLLIEAYGLMYRLAYRGAAPQDYVDKYKLAAFDALIHGDKTVDQYILYRTIQCEIRSRNKKYADKPLLWSSVTLDRWHADCRHGISWKAQTDYDALQQAATLIGENLFVYESKPDAFKKKLFECHRPLLDKIEAFDPKTLGGALQFMRASIKLMASDEYEALSGRLTQAVIAHPATNPFYRASLLQEQPQELMAS